MTHLQPAYMVAYVDTENPPRHMPIDFPRGAQVAVRTASLDGLFHYGEPKKIAYEDIPVLLFQLADAGYTIEPGDRLFPGIKSFKAYSPEFVRRVREFAANGMKS